ncbi:putative phage tail assembly chaperone [Pseudoalteromonas sp. CO348]|uniref:putative phage tail assembly chaperone n=1 Tax=Pseudoalteromonas sp. CO348 TaxID=1777271 RepID=UPI001F0F61D8|nr:putative phage tail assembly chaperone [Pseudoalteromonas sp. CO348]
MTMSLAKTIIIETDTTEFKFNVDTPAYNKYVNALTPINKIQPATNFLMSTVDESQAKALKDLLQQPAAALHMASTIVEDFQPEFNFTVKKSKSAPSK